jgi:hypothetical protein
MKEEANQEQSKAKQSKAKQSKAKQSKFNQLLKQKSSKNNLLYSQHLLLLLLLCLSVFGCSKQKEADLQGVRPVRLTGQAIDVLGFENAAHWNGINNLNSNSTQGSFSGEIVVNGWTQVSSINHVYNNNPGDRLPCAVRCACTPISVALGRSRLIIDIPSAGHLLERLRRHPAKHPACKPVWNSEFHTAPGCSRRFKWQL